MLRLPAPFVPHSASLSPATATRVLSTPVPVSAPPTSLDECLFSIFLVLVPLAVRFSVSSGCARRRSVSTYAAILVLPVLFSKWSNKPVNLSIPISLPFLPQPLGNLPPTAFHSDILVCTGLDRAVTTEVTLLLSHADSHFLGHM